MWQFLTSRHTRSDHCVPMSCRSIGCSTAAPDLVSNARPKPPLNQHSRPALLGLTLGGGSAFLANSLSSIRWAEAALTVTRPTRRRGGPCHGDVTLHWSNVMA
jgi:hypothetical protein